MMIKEASNTTLSSNKEKEGEHENYTADKVSTKMTERTEPEDGHDITTAVTKATTVGWMLDNTDNSSTTSKITSSVTTPTTTDCAMPNTIPSLSITELEPGSTGEEAQIDMGKQLRMALRQLQDILGEPSRS